MLKLYITNLFYIVACETCVTIGVYGVVRCVCGYGVTCYIVKWWCYDWACGVCKALVCMAL